MNVFVNIVQAVQMLAALAMIGLILIQHGKGADMGAAFGSGSAGSLFGASGSANFLSRSTAVLASVFLAATLALAYFGNLGPKAGSGSVLEMPGIAAPIAPAQPQETPQAVEDAIPTDEEVPPPAEDAGANAESAATDAAAGTAAQIPTE